MDVHISSRIYITSLCQSCHSWESITIQTFNNRSEYIRCALAKACETYYPTPVLITEASKILSTDVFGIFHGAGGNSKCEKGFY